MTMQQCNFPLPAQIAADGPEASSGLSQDARLYLRHVEGGESIRSLAREVGVHASTVMRRIRRFEARRDDPLIDGALNRHEGGGAEGSAGAGGIGWRHRVAMRCGRKPPGWRRTPPLPALGGYHGRAGWAVQTSRPLPPPPLGATLGDAPGSYVFQK